MAGHFCRPPLRSRARHWQPSVLRGRHGILGQNDDILRGEEMSRSAYRERTEHALSRIKTGRLPSRGGIPLRQLTDSTSGPVSTAGTR
jgi:hypothetical protein